MTIGKTSFRMRERNTWKVDDADPANASYGSETDCAIKPAGRELRLISEFFVTSDERDFHLALRRRLFEDGDLAREKKRGKVDPPGFSLTVKTVW